ncbi:hypothetical protein VTN31DRAFT_2855 [Thermomyces dupontii]|uniref:uncharacterized protein n=1 Tax=Talaromyces thermophilus TaxID=28565 RepID=UPI003742490F
MLGLPWIVRPPRNPQSRNPPDPLGRGRVRSIPGTAQGPTDWFSTANEGDRKHHVSHQRLIVKITLHLICRRHIGAPSSIWHIRCRLGFLQLPIGNICRGGRVRRADDYAGAHLAGRHGSRRGGSAGERPMLQGPRPTASHCGDQRRCTGCITPGGRRRHAGGPGCHGSVGGLRCCKRDMQGCRYTQNREPHQSHLAGLEKERRKKEVYLISVNAWLFVPRSLQAFPPAIKNRCATMIQIQRDVILSNIQR